MSANDPKRWLCSMAMNSAKSVTFPRGRLRLDHLDGEPPSMGVLSRVSAARIFLSQFEGRGSIRIIFC
jgi:hypothetical protein